MSTQYYGGGSYGLPQSYANPYTTTRSSHLQTYGYDSRSEYLGQHYNPNEYHSPEYHSTTEYNNSDYLSTEYQAATPSSSTSGYLNNEYLRSNEIVPSSNQYNPTYIDLASQTGNLELNLQKLLIQNEALNSLETFNGALDNNHLNQFQTFQQPSAFPSSQTQHANQLSYSNQTATAATYPSKQQTTYPDNLSFSSNAQVSLPVSQPAYLSNAQQTAAYHHQPSSQAFHASTTSLPLQQQLQNQASVPSSSSHINVSLGSSQLLNSSANQLLNSSTNQLLNSSANQLMNSSANQLLNSSANQLLNSSANQLMNSSANQLLNSSTNQLLNSSANQLLNSSANQLSNSSTNQLLNSSAVNSKVYNVSQPSIQQAAQGYKNSMDKVEEHHFNLGSALPQQQQQPTHRQQHFHETSHDQVCENRELRSLLESGKTTRRHYNSQSSTDSGRSSLLGLTDISARLEATLAPGSSTWTPLGVTSSSSAGTPSKSPSPNHLLPCLVQEFEENNPIEEFIFLSDDESSPVKLVPAPSNKATTTQPKIIPSLFSTSPVPTSVKPLEEMPAPKRFTTTASMTTLRPPLASSGPNNLPPKLGRVTSWSQIVRATPAATAPKPVVPSPPKSVSPSPPPPSSLTSTSAVRINSPVPEYHRGPKVDPRWPMGQQVFLGPIPISITWDEIRNTFYNKVARQHILHTYVQSKPVNDVVYGQIVFDKPALVNKILKDGPLKIRGHCISVTSMKEKTAKAAEARKK